MILIGIIIVIAVVSVGLSVWSLRREMKKTKHEEKVQEELAKGKVLFYSPSSGSEESADKS